MSDTPCVSSSQLIIDAVAKRRQPAIRFVEDRDIYVVNLFLYIAVYSVEIVIKLLPGVRWMRGGGRSKNLLPCQLFEVDGTCRR